MPRAARDHDRRRMALGLGSHAGLRQNFASRLERALKPDDFAVAFADPRQLSLFAGRLSAARPVLTRLREGDFLG